MSFLKATAPFPTARERELDYLLDRALTLILGAEKHLSLRPTLTGEGAKTFALTRALVAADEAGMLLLSAEGIICELCPTYAGKKLFALVMETGGNRRFFSPAAALPDGSCRSSRSCTKQQDSGGGGSKSEGAR